MSSRATRRRFTAEYKKKILDELDALTERGEVGALLRREGLYSSHVTAWRAERRAGELSGLEPKRRGPKRKEANPLAKELEAKERERGSRPRTRSSPSSARSKKKSRSRWA